MRSRLTRLLVARLVDVAKQDVDLVSEAAMMVIMVVGLLSKRMS
ncbi:MAG: hypothetical protein ACR2GC_00045 [Methyloceanibacter sp.]